MSRVLFFVGVLIFYSCSKTEIKPPSTVEIQEEAIKFSISPDISTNSYTLNKDTFDFSIAINSKIPSQGISYSIEIKRVDTNLTIYKIDTSSAQSSTNFKAVGLNIKANYNIKITLTSKSTSTSTNTVNQNYTLSRSRIYKNYLRASYELSNYDTWFSSAQLYKSDGNKYLNNPFIDEQSVQLDIDGDGLEDLFYFEGYDLQISPTPNPPPSIFLNNGTNLKQTIYTGSTIKNPHGTKLLVGDFNNDSLPDIFSNVAVDPPFFAIPYWPA
jgi:5-hydroxyisourate hydrolase-like protein (transthyretin family)